MLSIEDEIYTDLVITGETFSNKTYKNCEFINITFNKCLFKNVQFIDDCYLVNVVFDSCTSDNMDFEKIKLLYSIFLKSKMKSTSFINANISGSRFYSSMFLDTKFKDLVIYKTLLENSSFIRTQCEEVYLCSVSMYSIDFRNSSFDNFIFEYDVDIQESNFSDCKFVNSSFGIPHITDTIFDKSHFTNVICVNDSEIVNNSFENGVYENTQMFDSELVSHKWKPVAFNMLSPVSNRPQTLSDTRSRDLPLIYRVLFDKPDRGEIFHTQPRHIPSNSLERTAINIPDNQMAYEPTS